MISPYILDYPMHDIAQDHEVFHTVPSTLFCSSNLAIPCSPRICLFRSSEFSSYQFVSLSTLSNSHLGQCMWTPLCVPPSALWGNLYFFLPGPSSRPTLRLSGIFLVEKNFCNTRFLLKYVSQHCFCCKHFLFLLWFALCVWALKIIFHEFSILI